MPTTTETRLIGYARVSTDDQDLSLQIAALERAGVASDMIWREHASGKTMKRPVWMRLMEQIQPGDTIIVWKVDRLGRTLRGILETTDQLRECQVRLKTIDGDVDISTAIGRLNLHLIAAIAEYERGIIGERTKAGIAEKKKQGVKFGAKHSVRDHPARLAVCQKLLADGVLDSLTANELRAKLNDADPTIKPIRHVNTIRNWRQQGCPGL